MVRKFLMPVLAVGLFAFAVLHVVKAQQAPPPAQAPIQPPQAPFARTVAGVGLVEARTENISVGTGLPGVVTKVFVVPHQEVTAGDPLFQVDERPLRAELKVREAAVAAAEVQLARLGQLPRPEEVPPSTARVKEAEANLVDLEDLYRRGQMLAGKGAFADEELNRRRQAASMARQQLARVKAEHDLLMAGAWAADKAVAEAALAQARAQLEQTRTELERLTVRALVDGEVLQVNVRPGEFVGAPPGQALVVLGNLNQLHLRVDIDEHDIPRFRPGAAAKAAVRGEPGKDYLLTFVRVEPYVVPKKSLTGDNTERVDTRVLRVVYAIAAPPGSLYVGQQMDVFIDAAETAAGG